MPRAGDSRGFLNRDMKPKRLKLPDVPTDSFLGVAPIKVVGPHAETLPSQSLTTTNVGLRSRRPGVRIPSGAPTSSKIASYGPSRNWLVSRREPTLSWSELLHAVSALLTPSPFVRGHPTRRHCRREQTIRVAGRVATRDGQRDESPAERMMTCCQFVQESSSKKVSVATLETIS